MTPQHIKNRIAWLERFLVSKPDTQYYMGESEFAESSVEQENEHNEMLADEVKKEIKKLKTLLKKEHNEIYT